METSNGYRIAQVVLNGFHAFFSTFQNITITAQSRFEKAQWLDIQKHMGQRLKVYKHSLRQVKQTLEAILDDDIYTLSLWQQARLHYKTLTETEQNSDIMQTYFNSVFCLFLNHHHIKKAYTFSGDNYLTLSSAEIAPFLREFPLNEDLTESIRHLLNNMSIRLPYEDIDRDCRNIVNAINHNLIAKLDTGDHICHVEYLTTVFFRNKGAYLVGRILTKFTLKPFIVAFVNENLKLIVDTVLFSADEVSKVFSFTRSYFMVDANYPSLYVSFLKSIMPQKAVFEIYMALGFAKHGKTLFFDQTVKQTRKSPCSYVRAPGIKGMVMLVFTLPSLDYVYKLLKDKFTPPKDMTQQAVKNKYKLVKRHDRAGRMADTFEFHNLVFDIRKFSHELLHELYTQAPSKIKQQGNALIIEHVYVERKMVPLNLYLATASDEETEAVMIDYGKAIKELAAANIFPGDMLLKNFGVTRHGRVVFYDYDEVCLLTDCHFRDLPKPVNEAQELASTPWYTVADNDVFPEEFYLFFSGNKKARYFFERSHAELYSKAFWQNQQENIRKGVVASVYPYQESLRFNR